MIFKGEGAPEEDSKKPDEESRQGSSNQGVLVSTS